MAGKLKVACGNNNEWYPSPQAIFLRLCTSSFACIDPKKTLAHTHQQDHKVPIHPASITIAGLIEFQPQIF
jgi:hypothetical protein